LHKALQTHPLIVELARRCRTENLAGHFNQCRPDGNTVRGLLTALLDSLMHSDLRPFASSSDRTGLLHLVCTNQLRFMAAVFGVPGEIVLFIPLTREKFGAGASASLARIQA
jgi:hypothetical protein